MNNNDKNIQNIQFANSEIINKLNLLSDEYAVPFDALVNFAVIQLIDNVNLLRMLRNGTLNLPYLCERLLF